VTIPNSVFTDGLVENVTLEPTRKVAMSIGLIYDTTPKQLEEAMDILAEIHKSMSQLDEVRYISFTDFGDFSLGITFIYYIKKGEDIFGVKSEMNLNILKKFNAAGLEMAFPTQTIYTKKE
jgi:MscS family membrane protein